MKTLILGTIAAVGALGAIAAPASAGSVEVRIADLDLASAEGQVTLDRRINAAAKKVCGVRKAHANGPLAAAKARDCARVAAARATQTFAAAQQAGERKGAKAG